MKKINNERALLKKMNINSIDIIPQKMSQFVNLLPSIDKELATEIISQLPEFHKICKDILNSLDSSCARALESADRNLTRTIDTYTKILDGLNSRLLIENLSETDRKEITKDMVNIADKIAELHREHQNFILKVLRVILFPITVILLILISLVSGKDKKQ